MKWIRFVCIAMLASTSTSCLVGPYPCQLDRDCTDHGRVGLRCRPDDDGLSHCAFPDTSCPSGLRWDPSAAHPGLCLDPSCDDDIRNGTETDLDCGGSCPGCGIGNHCMSDRDCLGGTCSGGICCPVGYTLCGDQCLNLQNDPDHCGDCELVCSATNVAMRSCGGGICDGTCSPGYEDCNSDKLRDGCETDVEGDPDHCGSCDGSCSGNHVAVRTCTAGDCSGTCENGFANCDGDLKSNGCEINEQADPSHCGGCGRACSTNNVRTPSCAAGQCTSPCATGFADCDGDRRTNGCEINLNTDAKNCGGCGRQCSGSNQTNTSCIAGQCTGPCQSGFADCDGNRQNGCETNIASDPNNCNGCGTACSSNHIASRTCSGGVCNGPCTSGWADCNQNRRTDGCEQNIATDPRNCNGCGIQCSSRNIANPTCTGGQCTGVCNPGYGDCYNGRQSDGCETNLLTDVRNCGGCGMACVAGLACDSGRCVVPGLPQGVTCGLIKRGKSVFDPVYCVSSTYNTARGVTAPGYMLVAGDDRGDQSGTNFRGHGRLASDSTVATTYPDRFVLPQGTTCGFGTNESGNPQVPCLGADPQFGCPRGWSRKYAHDASGGGHNWYWCEYDDPNRFCTGDCWTGRLPRGILCGLTHNAEGTGTGLCNRQPTTSGCPSGWNFYGYYDYGRPSGQGLGWCMQQ